MRQLFDDNDLMKYWCLGYKDACKQLLAIFYSYGFPMGESKGEFIRYCEKRIADMDVDIAKHQALIDERKRRDTEVAEDGE